MNYVDSRLIDHGLRVANMTYRMLEAQNSHEQKYLQDVFMLALLHNIGAYKTELIKCLFLRQKIYGNMLFMVICS